MAGHRFSPIGALVAGLCWILTAGCSAALEREGRCLASLSPDFLSAYEEIRSLEGEWREAVRARQEGWFYRMRSSMRSNPGATSGAGSASGWYEFSPTKGEERAYAKLAEAKARHRETMEWYGRVYDRFRTRLEEEQLLSETLAVLLTSPAIIFYPIVRRNIRTALWDGIDPDADTDAVTQFCRIRLAVPSHVVTDGALASKR